MCKCKFWSKVFVSSLLVLVHASTCILCCIVKYRFCQLTRFSHIIKFLQVFCFIVIESHAFLDQKLVRIGFSSYLVPCRNEMYKFQNTFLILCVNVKTENILPNSSYQPTYIFGLTYKLGKTIIEPLLSLMVNLPVFFDDMEKFFLFNLVKKPYNSVCNNLPKLSSLCW